jgi:glycogen debranching enzyme
MADPQTTVVNAAHSYAEPELQGAGAYHILASASPADERTRVLKHNDTFAVFDHYGDIQPGGLGEGGLYHDGTRFLSCLLLELEGRRPFFLSSTVRNESNVLAVSLTNPDLLCDNQIRLPLGTLHIAAKKFLWQGVCYHQLRVKNHALDAVDTAILLHFDADFVDIFEVRGMKRKERGDDLPPDVADDHVVLGYRGLDGVVRMTRLEFEPAPSRLTSRNARYDLALKPQQEAVFMLRIGCDSSTKRVTLMRNDEARREAQVDRERYMAWSCRIHTSNGQLNAWVDRATSDLHMMTTDLPTGLYPYAGVPWFNTAFGRDGIITAMQCLWLRPSLAKGVLAFLAATQATEVIPEQDAEPGKILHETRSGEMPALKEVPFGRYYGSVDGTPLFAMLAGAYFHRTGDREFIRSIWPNVQAALRWIDQYGDRDGDGFIEYHRQAENGLVHQGWKDSDEAVFHADGSSAHGPIALCEVQAYAYAAKQAGMALAAELGELDIAEQLARES